MFQLTAWSAPPMLVILLTGLTVHRLTGNRNIPGVMGVQWLLVGVLIWSMAQLAGTLVFDLSLKVIAHVFEHLGKVIIPVAWFVFTLTFSNNRIKISSTALMLVSFTPFLTMLLVVTNDMHQLVWLNAELTSIGGYVGFAMEPGPWLSIISIYAYGLVLAGTAILANTLNQSRHLIKPLIAVITAPLIVSGFTLMNDMGFGPIPGVSLAPLALTIGVFVLRAGVLSPGLLADRPVLRHHVVEQLTDMVVIIDSEARVLDLNPAAARGLAIQVNTQLDDELQLPAFSELIRTNRSNIEITIGDQAYDVQSNALSDRQLDDGTDQQPERVLVFRNITERRKAETALHNAKEELQTQAHTDPLTSLYNRRYFMQRLTEEAERLRRHNNLLSVLIFDLDHFKKVNDNFGHDVGDEIIKMVARKTIKATRLTDVAARLGGEEFAMLLPETDREGAVKLANRLRKSIAGAQVITKYKQQVTITASIGIATVNRIGDNLDSVLNLADKALYRAKDSGRNMVCVAD